MTAISAIPVRGQASRIGSPSARMDGRAKVTGEARYASDMPVQNPAYAFLVTSGIARGRILRIDETDARAVPGVLDILTHENTAGAVRPSAIFAAGGFASTSIRPLDSAEIEHDGQIVAVVLADTYESAREAAHRLQVDYQVETPSATFGADGLTTQNAADVDKTFHDAKIGDAEAAFAAAPVTIDVRYATPIQHHNPIELFTTTCVWDGEKLTIYEPSQFMYGLKFGTAHQLGIDPANIRTVSHFVGGAFGSKASVTPRTSLIAIAARRLNRPVKLVATRAQGFSISTHRAETQQRVRLAAAADGKLQALMHEGWEITSRPDPYKVGGTSATSRMYACPNVATHVTVVHADRDTPGFMRSPPELPYMFGLECAMDELADALQMDPIELRRANDTQNEPIKGLAYTSRNLMPCFDAAAEAFGWSRRDRRPGSMREGDWLVGWGCATSCYPSFLGPAATRIRLAPDGRVRVQVAAHEIGTGTMTAIGLTAADRLGVSLDHVEVEIGDSELPPATVAGGSNSTASICNVVAIACEQIRQRVAQAAVQANSGAFAGRDPATLRFDDGHLAADDGVTEPLGTALGRMPSAVVEAYSENNPPGVEQAVKRLYQGGVVLVGGERGEDSVRFAFGAEFVEVRIHSATGEIRVPRVVGAFAAGRIVNPMAARSQLMGGLIWGVSSALHEATEIDRRTARYVNTNLADYLVPVNADIQQVEVIMLPETDDKVNPLGIKGIGELGNVGTNAAVANAVFHATGKRVRELPIRIEQLIA